jgi:hypothetical protein
MRVLRALGMDGAVTYTFLARLTNIVSSTGTVLLIIHYLSPIEQGYYYTLLSLVSLQMIFELGFSFVILQLAAHETARLTLSPSGQIEGDIVARRRLAAVFQLTVKWYLRAAIALAVLLLPLGIAFFAGKDKGITHVAWFGPWVSAVFAVSLSFLLTPLYSFLEGCNLVREVARMRMIQALFTLLLSWTAIASGHSLYTSALINFGYAVIGAGMLYRWRRLLASLLRCPDTQGAISWRQEVWPFQWKIAVAWLASYFTLQVFTPILFVFRGPQEAGRMGLSLSIVTYIPFLALCWILPKAAPFGRLVNLGQLQELDRVFFRALRQSFALIVAIAAACETGVIAAHRILPGIAARMEPPRIFIFLLAAAIGSFLVQSLAVYLRSFKREPYLLQSVVVAALTTAVALLTASRWGGAAIALDYFALSGVFGLTWAVLIFRTFRCQRTNAWPLRQAQQIG